MAINNNVIVQYNGGFLPNILLLTQAPIILLLYNLMALLSYIITILLPVSFSIIMDCFVICFVVFGI